MAVNIYPRKPVSRPHTKVTVDTSGIGGSSSGSEKLVMLIGSAKGGKPDTVYRIRNYQDAKRIFREGDLLDAMELAWNPSSDSDGAGDILAMRVEDAKNAKLEAGGLTFESTLYGREANDIQLTLEENTLTKTKRLIVDFAKDRVHQVYDNLGNIFKVEYLGDSGQATLTVEKDTTTGLANKLVIKVGDVAKSGEPKAGLEVVKSYDLTSGVFSDINVVITDINNLPDFKATFFPFGDKNIESKYLDIQADVDLKASDPVYITALSGDIAKQLKYDSYVTVTVNRSKEVITFPTTMLSGGDDGLVPESWATKLEKFSNEGGYYLVPLTPKQAVHSEATAFVTDRADEGEPMRVICGGGSGESVEELFQRQTALTSPRAMLIGASGTRNMDDGRVLKIPSYMLASQVAGVASGLDIGSAITFKSLLLNELDIVYKKAQIDQLTVSGIVVVEFVRNRLLTAFRIVDDVTTFNDRTDPVKNQMGVGEANDFFVSELMVNLDNAFIGTKVVEISAQVIKNHIQSWLDDKKRKQEIQGYTPEDVQVILEGDVATISMTVFPMMNLKKIDVRVTYRQQILTA